MRVVIQRVSRAHVEVAGEVTGRIGKGLLVLLGIGRSDAERDAEYLVDKVIGLRIFPDAAGKMNVNLADAQGGLLVISQFTLYGDCRRGRRPSFDEAAPPDRAEHLYNRFLQLCRQSVPDTQAGVFQAHMDVHLVNDGPVTVICDSA